MAFTKIGSIRNIGIMAHIDAGKTTLSERMLFYCRKIHKLGEVHDGAATMDFMPEEQERGITITSACTTCHWGDTAINLVDTPGHVDFTMEVQRCMRVLDGAIAVFCAVGGVEPQSETVWRQSENFNVPKLAFINKIDREGADFEGTLAAMRSKLGANPVALNIPLGQGSQFSGLLDLINGQKIIFDQDSDGRVMEKTPFTPEEEAMARPWQEKLHETIAEVDDEFMELWLGGEYGQEDVLKALRRATLVRTVTPVFCGAALRNIGVQPVLDAIRELLPSPLDIPPVEGLDGKGKEVQVVPDPKAPPAALVFKVAMEGTRKNVFVRSYSGVLAEGLNLCNGRTGKNSRIGRLTRIHADRREELGELGPGDIACIVGLNDAQTGDTYSLKEKPIILETIQTYQPVITIALEPLNSEEAKLLDEALGRYAEEDPTLKYGVDEESGMRTLSGMGELHLDVVLERLGREYKLKPRAGQPQVVLRETAQSEGRARALFDRELGKEHHQGEVEVVITPRERGTGIIVTDYLPESEQEARRIIPTPMRQAVREGVEDSLQSGVLGGWPVTDVAVHIADIGRQEGLTTIPGLRMAASRAVRDALQKAACITLEPIVTVDITTPEEFLGNVINLFNQTGGRIESVEEQGGSKQVNGTAPMRNLFGFATSLRSASRGRAGFSMTFKAFDQI